MGRWGLPHPPLSPPSGMKTEKDKGVRLRRRGRPQTAFKLHERERGKKKGNKIHWKKRDQRTGHSHNRAPGGRDHPTQTQQKATGLSAGTGQHACATPDLVLSSLPAESCPSAVPGAPTSGDAGPPARPPQRLREPPAPAHVSRQPGLPRELLNRIFYKYTTYKNC